MGGPRLQYTKDYSLFELHEFNRDLHKDTVLEESMKKHGFMPSSPLQCIKNGNGKLKIIRGHHRFDRAKRLDLGIWYIVDESNTDIFDLESGQSKWTVADFAKARANAGDEDCIKLLNFMKRHHLPIGAAGSLVGGESAGSNNKVTQIKTGRFHVGDLKHANEVVRVTDRCRELNISFASTRSFISAVSLCLRIPEFNLNLFIHKIQLNGSNIRKRATTKEYLEEIDALYNYGASKHRFPVAFRAKEVSKERSVTFGRGSD